jgi:hypothetical protein
LLKTFSTKGTKGIKQSMMRSRLGIRGVSTLLSFNETFPRNVGNHPEREKYQKFDVPTIRKQFKAA